MTHDQLKKDIQELLEYLPLCSKRHVFPQPAVMQVGIGIILCQNCFDLWHADERATLKPDPNTGIIPLPDCKELPQADVVKRLKKYLR